MHKIFSQFSIYMQYVALKERPVSPLQGYNLALLLIRRATPFADICRTFRAKNLLNINICIHTIASKGEADARD